MKSLSATTRRNLWLALVGLLILLALVLGFRQPAKLIESAEVRHDHFRMVVEEEGRTRMRDRYEISAPVSGYLARVQREPGDSVAAGDPLFSLYPPPADPLDNRTRGQMEGALQRAAGRIQAARMDRDAQHARAELAEAERKRAERLFEQGNIPRDELDRARTEARSSNAALRSAEFNVQVAEFEREMIQASLRASAEVERGEMVQVKAPVDGLVLRRHRESEGLVQAGTPILQLGDPKSLEVRVEVLSADAVRLRPEMRVELERWGGDEALAGRVRRVEPAGFTKVSALGVEEERVPVVVDLELEQPAAERLGDGFRVEARFVLVEEDEVLQVPAGALFRRDGQWGVFELEDDRARYREVEVGRRAGLYREVLGGLNAGQRVILHPGQDITDGSRVRER